MTAASLRIPNGADALRTLRGHHRALGWYPVLWAALAVISAVIIIPPEFPVAGPGPVLSIAASTLAAAMGLTILYLGVLRFSVLGQASDLFAGLAFGTLGASTLLLRLLPQMAPSTQEQSIDRLYLVLLARGVAAALFVISIATVTQEIGARSRLPFAIRAGLLVILAVSGLSLATLAAEPALPIPAGPGAWQLIHNRAVVADSLPEQASWLTLANGVIAVLELIAAVGFASRAQRLRTPHLHTVAITLSLIAFAHLHALFFPPLDASYMSAGDVFQLAGYVVMLCGLARHMGREITEHVSRDERLRLSRELHDGLTQHLGLLHLRLNQAVAPKRGPEKQVQDLEAARRLVEAALIEARQAVISLRVDTISWDQFQHSLNSFANEFGRNHDVQIDLSVDGASVNTDAGVQAEVLRILHEAFSNAIRHGGASRITTHILAKAPSLEIVVHDDGSGFDVESRAEDGGVGLLSMQERIGRRGGKLSVDSTVGRGTTLQASLPLRAPDGART